MYRICCCLCGINMKRVVLILIWIFIVQLISIFTFISLANDVKSYYDGELYLLQSTNFVINAIFLGLYPLAGILADNKLGRFKTITRSAECLLVLLLLVYTCLFALVILSYHWNTDSAININSIQIIVDGLILPIEICLVMFNANIIQFGVDQLQDSPADHQSLFIYWYVWMYYLANLTVQLIILMTDYVSNFYLQELALTFTVLVILCTMLSIVHYNKHWFIIDTARSNPYKLVHRVTKFARQHKVPIRRSAFTYCEDDIPSGLDLGKSKYGGPFTTEQVEDVKAFYGILKILFSLGVTFFLDYISGHLSKNFFDSIFPYIIGKKHQVYYVVSSIVLQQHIFSLSVVVISIPIFIIFIRPHINKFYLTMLKRIGVGTLLLLLSVTCSFVAITVNYTTAHNTNGTDTCLLDNINTINNTNTNLTFTSIAFLLQQCLYALSAMFLYPALYEFICAQSPHAMKGMLIGLSFAIKGLFQLLGFAVTVFFIVIKKHFLSCAIYLYILTIVVGVVGLAVYVYVARKYKLRERDEPCHVRRFVEEYYSKMQEE